MNTFIKNCILDTVILHLIIMRFSNLKNHAVMKKAITAIIACLPVISVLAQDEALPIVNINREQIEKMGATNITALIATIPMAKGGENYGFGAGIRVQRNFGRSLVLVDGQRVDPGRTAETNDNFIITKEEINKYGSTGSFLDDISKIEVIKGGAHAEFGYTRLFGKTETIGNQTYEYEGLNIVHAFVGYHRLPCDQADLSIEAGPALGIFSNGSEFGLGGSINGVYHFNDPAKQLFKFIKTGQKPITWSVGASLDFFKLNEVDLILNPGVNIRMSF